MPWFKVDDGLHKSRKRIRLGRTIEGMAALGLWTHLGSWSADELTEGFVSDSDIEYLAPKIGQRLAKRLEAVGLFERVTRDDVTGWYFHDWDDFQPSKEEVLADRAANAARQKRFRDKAKAARLAAAQDTSEPEGDAASEPKGNAVSNAVTNAATNAAVTPSVTVPPTRPDPTYIRTTNQQPSVVAQPAPSVQARATVFTPTQRSKTITDAYAVVEPMSKWPAVNAIVLRAIKAGRWSDNEIQDALLRLAEDKRPVTVDTMRVELDGLPPTGQARHAYVERNGHRLKPDTALLVDDDAKWAAADAERAAITPSQRLAIEGIAS